MSGPFGRLIEPVEVLSDESADIVSTVLAAFRDGRIESGPQSKHLGLIDREAHGILGGWCLRIGVPGGLRDRGGDLLSRFDTRAGDVDGTDQNLLVGQVANERDRYLRWDPSSSWWRGPQPRFMPPNEAFEE